MTTNKIQPPYAFIVQGSFTETHITLVIDQIIPVYCVHVNKLRFKIYIIHSNSLTTDVDFLVSAINVEDLDIHCLPQSILYENLVQTHT